MISRCDDYRDERLRDRHLATHALFRAHPSSDGCPNLAPRCRGAPGARRPDTCPAVVIGMLNDQVR